MMMMICCMIALCELAVVVLYNVYTTHLAYHYMENYILCALNDSDSKWTIGRK